MIVFLPFQPIFDPLHYLWNMDGPSPPQTPHAHTKEKKKRRKEEEQL
jgi:hypothetical protein